MTIEEQLEILANSAKYDVSCASSGSSVRRPGEVGCVSTGGICHSWSADGRCISLLKVLLTNTCIYDCAYCVNRRSNDIPRAAFDESDLVDLTMSFYRRNYIEGLFLSSGIARSPDDTMERMNRVARGLREAGFGGYIHLKAIPGTAPELVREAGLLADRLSVNIELPSESSLALLAPPKAVGAPGIRPAPKTKALPKTSSSHGTEATRKRRRRTQEASPSSHSRDVPGSGTAFSSGSLSTRKSS